MIKYLYVEINLSEKNYPENQFLDWLKTGFKQFSDDDFFFFSTDHPTKLLEMLSAGIDDYFRKNLEQTRQKPPN